MKKLLLVFTALLLWAGSSWGQISGYTFNSAAGTYTEITGGTVVATATSLSGAGSLDDIIYTLADGTIPFNFSFNGTNYSGFRISTNGFITFGTTAPAGNLYAPINSTTAYAGCISPIGCDLNALFNIGGYTGEIRYETLNATPDRIFVIQYKNFRPYSTSGVSPYWRWNFQIRLSETSNVIQIVYNFNFSGSPTAGTAQVGLRGANNTYPGSINNRLITSGTHTWATSVPGTSNASTCAYSTTLLPASGLTYTFTPPNPCSGTPVPGNTLSSSNPACSGVNFTLSLQNATPGTGVTYQWQYGPSNTGPWTPFGTSTPTATTSQIVATWYQCTVTCTNSGFSGTSTPVEVTMLVASVPYTEGFITTTTPSCWNITGWTIGAARGVTGNPGNNIYKNFYSSAATATFTTVNIGPLGAGMVLTFDYKLANFSIPYDPPASGSGNYVVSVSTNGGTTYDPLETVVNDGVAGWQSKSYPLTSYVGSNIMIKIVGNWSSGDYDLAFDNIKIDTPPLCVAPTGLSSDGYTTVGADLHWSSVDSFFDIFIQGTATPAPDELTTPTADNVSGNSYTWAGGSPATPYYWWVRTDCAAGTGTGVSEWTGPNSFTTACDALSSFPWTENFEYTFLPNCWSKIVYAGNDITQSSTQNHTTFGTYSASFSSYNSSSNYNQYLFSPQVTVSAGYTKLSFWHRKYDTSAELLEWGIASTTNPGDYTWTAVTLSNTAWQETVVDLTPWIGMDVYIGFHYYGNYLYYVYLDDVSIDAAPSCPAPTLQTASNFTASGADLGWTSVESFFDIYIVPTGDPAPTAGSTPSVDNYNSNSYTWAGGSESTTYDWYVRADCAAGGGSGQSDWTGPNTFTTLCPAVDLPYTEGFESMVTDFSCWSVMGNTAAEGGLNGSNLVPRTGNTWSLCTPASFSGDGATYIHSGIRSAALGYTAPDFNWLISSDINMPATGNVDLKFWLWYRSDNQGVTKFYVNVFADGIWSTILTYNTIAQTNQYATEIMSSLDAYIGKVIRIAFVYEYNDGWQLAVDDISIKVVPVTATWTGAVSSAWADAGNWNPDLPGSITDVIIPAGLTNYPTLTAAGWCHNFTIQSNGAGTGSIIGNEFLTITGTTTVERYITGLSQSWHLISSPVAAQAISPAFTAIPASAYDFFAWYEPTETWVNFKYTSGTPPTWTTANGSTDFTVGKGYLVEYLGTGLTKQFQGNLNTGTVSFPLTNSGFGTYVAYNLAGNPYPSAIDWKAASWGRGSLVWNSGGYDMSIWNDAVGQYGTYNSASLTDDGTNSVTRYIPVAQGFMVKASAAGALGMDNGTRVHNTQAFLKSTDEISNILRMKVTGNSNSYSDEIVVEFGHQISTGGAEKMFGFYETAPSLYTVKPTGNYSIDFRGEPGAVVIPVSFNAGIDGNYTLTASQLESFTSSTVITLEDVKASFTQNLMQNPVYNFSAAKNDEGARFFLHFGGAFSLNDKEKEQPVSIYASGNSVYISNQSGTMLKGEVIIYNMIGQPVMHRQLSENPLTKINLSGRTGYYLVKVITGNNIYSAKVFINKE